MTSRHAARHQKIRATVEAAEALIDADLRRQVEKRFGTQALDKHYDPVVRWSVRAAPHGAPGTPMLFLSDWHYGEQVDPEQVFGSNKFDRTTAIQRLKHTVVTATELLNVHLAHPKYPGLVLVLGGDMINGSLHEDSAFSDEVPPLMQAYEMSKHLSDSVAFLAYHFALIEVYCVPGNHGRITRKPWSKFYAHQNLDWLCYKMTADNCAKLKNVRFHAPPARDLTFNVANRRFRLTHGDQFKGGDGIIGPLGPVIRGDARKRITASMMPGQPEQYDTLLCGHFHQLVMLPRLIINGSGKGYDEFALQIGATWEPPQQALWTVHPKHGITWYMPVVCDDDFNAHALVERVK